MQSGGQGNLRLLPTANGGDLSYINQRLTRERVPLSIPVILTRVSDDTPGSQQMCQTGHNRHHGKRLLLEGYPDLEVVDELLVVSSQRQGKSGRAA
jgi:hypothetical protein